MKVVHLSFSDKIGGAGIAAYRHHEAMQSHGINSAMVVLKKQRNQDYIVQIESKRSLRKIFFKTLNKLFNIVYRPRSLWSLWFGNDISTMSWIVNADVIFIHWTNFNTLSVKSIVNILKLGKPTYIMMHDMWFITGGCHHSFNCDNYKTTCKRCPQLKRLLESLIDLAEIGFKKKIELSCFSNLKIITPSDWLLKCVKKSSLFRNTPSQTVRNYIDTNIFRPIQFSKSQLGLNNKKITILFGADSIDSPYKGWNYLLEILNSLNSDKFEVAIFGRADSDSLKNLKLTYHLLGQINNEEQLVRIYNSCDILAIASKADNYPNVILEGMSCGLPVIAFSVGGISEMIEDGKSGFLIPPYDIDLYERKLEYFASLPTEYRIEMSHYAIEQIKRINSYSAAKWPL